MPDCSGHGVCEDGVCVCIKGYKGEFCQEGKIPASVCFYCITVCCSFSSEIL